MTRAMIMTLANNRLFERPGRGCNGPKRVGDNVLAVLRAPAVPADLEGDSPGIY